MPTFAKLLSHAQKKLKSQPELADYWNGYIRGLHWSDGRVFGLSFSVNQARSR